MGQHDTAGAEADTLSLCANGCQQHFRCTAGIGRCAVVFRHPETVVTQAVAQPRQLEGFRQGQFGTATLLDWRLIKNGDIHR